jgi:hypothetical protein
MAATTSEALVIVTIALSKKEPGAPGARVIKAFNTLFAPDLARDPRHDGGQRVLFYCGDDPGAKAAFAGVAGQAGWFPVDLGSLRDGGPLPGLHLLTGRPSRPPARMPVPDYGHRLEFATIPEPLQDRPVRPSTWPS